MEDVKRDLIMDEDAQKDKFLTFKIADDHFAIEVLYVTEIIKIQEITSMPDSEYYVKGIINLRGSIVPVMDMRLRFNKDVVDYNERTCIIVIDVDNVRMGLIVDSVSEVAIIPEKDIVVPLDIKKGKQKYIKGLGKTPTGVKLILDCDKLILVGDAANIVEGGVQND